MIFDRAIKFRMQCWEWAFAPFENLWAWANWAFAQLEISGNSHISHFLGFLQAQAVAYLEISGHMASLYFWDFCRHGHFPFLQLIGHWGN